ncbi:PilZ domain-containing protein [Planctomycetota bacterium]
MNACSACQAQVKKLFRHPQTNLRVCYSCLPQEEQFFSIEDLGPDTVDPDAQERRAHMRVPVSLSMSFDMGEPGELLQLSHPAVSVNISLGGVCFAWEPLNQYLEEDNPSIDSTSIFFPYYKGNQQSRDLSLSISFSSDTSLSIPGKIVYTARDSAIGVEYVGTQFSPLGTQQQKFLETVLFSA